MDKKKHIKEWVGGIEKMLDEILIELDDDKLDNISVLNKVAIIDFLCENIRMECE